MNGLKTLEILNMPITKTFPNLELKLQNPKKCGNYSANSIQTQKVILEKQFLNIT